MKYPGLIAELAQLCKQAGIGTQWPRPRPTETPAQAKRAIGRTDNFSTGGVLQQAAPQKPATQPAIPVQQPPQAGRLPQMTGSE